MQSIPKTYLTRHLVQAVAGLVAVVMGAFPVLPALAVDLADQPLFSVAKVPGNLALVLSVEYPTATSMAYIDTYSPANTYIGYFNPEMCYTYQYNASTPAQSYFRPDSKANSHVCSGKWSGNYMNWASMQTLDAFRGIMTGGYRSTDTATGSGSDTILTKTWSAAARTKSTKSVLNKTTSLVAGATPLNWSTVTTRTRGLGSSMWIAKNAQAIDKDGHTIDWLPAGATPYQPGLTDDSQIYEVYINVAVCVSAALKEDNCVRYPNNGTPVYKPEGLMQQYAMQIRFAAFGYLNGEDSLRDGGVLRARMNYIGPNKPQPGGQPAANTFAEWSAVTGIMTENPAPLDAADTYTTFNVNIANSGSMNYLNKFGYAAQNYEGYDNVSELYYTALRYFKGQSNVASYSANTTAALADGFPVITKWRKADDATMGADPVLYSCQRNFILGIGDANTHNDANLPGNQLTGGQEPAMPPEVSADSTVDVTTATDMVGKLEGATSRLSGQSPFPSWYDTYYIAGLAYDAHTVDIRPTLTGSGLTADTDMSGSQTISTYWLDVLEKQTYLRKNPYWLAAKYGGFTVPKNFQPYAATRLDSSLWYTNSDTSRGKSNEALTQQNPAFNTSTADAYDPRPDNFFFGSSPAAMKSGLTLAFSKISSELGASHGTAYASASANVEDGDAGYSASFDPSTWTSRLQGYATQFDVNGNLIRVGPLEGGYVWDARDKLEAATSRKIVTYCDKASTPAGIAFTASALANCPTTGRLNYASFANITGVTTTSENPKADYVDYLRGNRSKEIRANDASAARIYRQRAYLLGDIVNSKVKAVGAPHAPYYDVYNPGYSAFKQTYANRRAVVYVGANDGMLHAFDGNLPGYQATTSGGTTTVTWSDCSYCGQELFAYIPSFAYNGSNGVAAESGLASLGNPNRSHYFMVDATPLSFDVDLNNVCGDNAHGGSKCRRISTETSAWRSLLIGGLGKGGKGFYALDVTAPGTVTTTTTTTSSTTTVSKSLTDGDWTTEAAVAGKVLWEFPNSSDTATIAKMGYSYGAPMVAKTKKYGWVVIFTSGYNNSDGQGYFFIVNPRTGALLETVATTSGSTTAPLNLAQANIWIPDQHDYTADAIYAGDLQGHLWRVDLTSTNEAYPAPTLMASFFKPNSNGVNVPQPISTRPAIGIDPITSKRYVAVGTGRLLADSDMGSTEVQSIYSIYDGIRDYGRFQAASAYSTALTRSALASNTNLVEGIGSSPSSSAGWYHDLAVSTTAPYPAGQVYIDPDLRYGIVGFGVNVPDGSVCTPSGRGTMVGVKLGTGKSVLKDAEGAFIAESSMSGRITSIGFRNVNGTVRLMADNNKGETLTPDTDLPTSKGVQRMNWREVPTQ